MKVVVTGGTGFVGRHVVWRLVALGHDVVFTGRDASQAAIVIAGAGGEARFVPLAHGDPDAAATLVAAAAHAGAIVHCAALSSPWGKRSDFVRANVASAREVVAACGAHAIARLVHLSTPSLYFDFSDRLLIREDAPLPRPVNAYAETKGIAEGIVAGSAIDHVIVLRPRAIFGPWDTTLLPRLLRVARRARLPLMRDGDALLDLTYIDNVVDAVVLALASPARRAIFNISNGEPVRVRDLFETMATAFGFAPRFRALPYPVVDAIAATMEVAARLVPGWEPPLTRYSAGLLAFSQTLDLSAARDRLGYRPRVSLAEGMRLTSAWFGSAP